MSPLSARVAARAVFEAARLVLNPGDFPRRNDTYNFIRPLAALIKTGPTGTNVIDVRLFLIDR